MSAPRVSILIPCLDEPAALEEALDLAFAQSGCEFEILVLDRGSTQARMAATVRELRWPRTRCLVLPGYSRAAALERGVAEAAAEFVVVFAASAALSPSFLADSLQAFDHDGRLGLLKTASEPGTRLGRRDWIRGAGGFETVGKDADPGLRARMEAGGHRVAVIPEPEPRRRHPEIHAPAESVEASGPTPVALFDVSQGSREAATAEANTDRELLTRLASLESALESARGDARSLRTSLSWRVTAPLRALHRWLTRS